MNITKNVSLLICAFGTAAMLGIGLRQISANQAALESLADLDSASQDFIMDKMYAQEWGSSRINDSDAVMLRADLQAPYRSAVAIYNHTMGFR